MDFASWSLGLSLIVLTLAVHTTGVVLMAFELETRMQARSARVEGDRAATIRRMIGNIGAAALILTALHGCEGVLWALAYWWLGAFESFTDASVYSLGSMTTFDIPGLVLPARFHMFSALEAVNGALLFGISTAFLFAVIQAHWSRLSHRRAAAE